MALFPFFFTVLHDGDCSLVLTACSKYLICCVGALYYWFYLYVIARASSTYLIKMSFDVPILQDACLRVCEQRKLGTMAAWSYA